MVPVRTAPLEFGFVGRDRERGLLAQAIEQAGAGRGQVVLIGGSAGIGKTALCRQAAAIALGAGLNVLWGRCHEEPGAPALWPWRQLLRQLMQLRGQPILDAAIAQAPSRLLAVLPELNASAAAQLSSHRTLATAHERFELFDLLAAFWQRVSTAAPCLLILEDLHWADAPSMRLLAFLATELPDMALMIIGTRREDTDGDEFLADSLVDLARHAHFRRLGLQGLTRAETERFAVETAGMWPDEQLIQALHQRTEGHPLYLQELLRLMAERKEAGLPVVGEPAISEVPEGLRAVIGRRLRAVDPFALEVLQAAACIGRNVDLALLAGALGIELDAALFAALQQAIARRLLEPTADAMCLRFTHAMIRETLCGELLGAQRAALHKRIGLCLERAGAANSPAQLPLLAHHFSEAADLGVAGQAIDLGQRAAEMACEEFAFERAAVLYERALALHTKFHSAERERRLRLLCGLAHAYQEVGAGIKSLPLWTEAAALARATGADAELGHIGVRLVNAYLLAATALDVPIALLNEILAAPNCTDPRVRVELLTALCRALASGGRLAEVEYVHREATAKAHQLGDTALVLEVELSLLPAPYRPDRLRQRIELGRHCFQVGLREQRHYYLLDLVLPYYGLDLARAGGIAELKDLLIFSERGARRLPSPYPLLQVLNLQVLTAIHEARFADAEALAQQALELGRRGDAAQAHTAFGMRMFAIRREQGRLQEAEPLLRQLVAAMPQAATWRPGLMLLYAELGRLEESRAEFEAMLLVQHEATSAGVRGLTEAIFFAETCVELDDKERAAALYEELLPHSGTVLVSDLGGPFVGAADRLLGMLATLLERWEPARQHFDAGLALDQRCGHRGWAAHGRYRLARMLSRRGRKADLAEARGLLTGLAEHCANLGLAALSVRAAALARSLELQSADPAYPCGLTAREVELMRLIAIGRSNRECAQALAISANTVAAHIRNILHKTYTANRTEAAAFARQHRLLDD